MINTKQKIREKLQLRPVGLESLDQFNELLRYVFQVTNRDLEESGYEDGEIVRAKRPVLRDADVIGWFNDDQLVSQLCIYPCKINIHGKIFEMAGLTGVGTYPEYANMGLMHDLIRVALNKMRENQQWISYLYPYSVPFYRNKGWEIFSEHLVFSIKDTQIPKYKDVPGFVERLNIDDPDVITVYDNYALNNHGSMIRNQLSWDEYWRWENEEERTAAVYYDASGKPMGYILYWVAKDIFHIKDMLYLNQEARRGLWNFIYAHLSMVDKVKGNIYRNEPIAFLLEDSHIQESIEPYYMARIVDVEAFLKAYPFEELDSYKPFHFIVTDPVAEWNNGIFGVSWNEQGEVQISREAIGAPVELSIQTLSAMLMSFRRPAYFYKLERIKTHYKVLRILEELIPSDSPYFSDYF
ncbi:GNAT family N-acetyltransferase [Utexia brackfieldae]|uniref:GNAT family N-acetyltransferase n=1 Tax=Utexia brackfieldae TaxID=3074108 RepID=UPI00370DBE38